MCYWYADSTFEVLFHIGGATQVLCAEKSQRRGVWTLNKVNYVAYTGMTRRSLVQTCSPDTPARAGIDEDELHQQQLIHMQGELVAKYGKSQSGDPSEESAADLTTAEREPIKQNGWNVARFLAMVQQMPTIRSCSHEEEARESARMERTIKEEENKWRQAIEKVQFNLVKSEYRKRIPGTRLTCGLSRSHASKRAEQERQRFEQERQWFEQVCEQSKQERWQANHANK